MKETEIRNFISAADGKVWTEDPDLLDILFWYGADVIWGQGPNRIEGDAFILHDKIIDPGDLEISDRKRGYAQLILDRRHSS